MNSKEITYAMRASKTRAVLSVAFLAAALICAVAVCAVAMATVGPRAQAYAADARNGWQVVSGGYDSQYTTSEGLTGDQLGVHNFIESEDGAVRVTKTVEPTGVEDEFIVHLSVDTCAIAAQQTDYKAFFESMPWAGVSSNNYHDADLGTVKDGVNGSSVTVVGGSRYASKGTFTIQDPQGRTIAENVTISWDHSNNFTVFVEISGKYIMMGLSVKGGMHNTVRLSDEAYKLVEDAIRGLVKQGPKPALNSVTDVMGSSIAYLGQASAGSGAVSYDANSSALTWKPEYSSSCKVVEEEPVTDIERNEYGAVTRLTITQRTWYYGAASLSYKVRLNTGNGFASSYHPDEVTNPYVTNERATLDYTYWAYNKEDDQFHEYANSKVDFPQPQVKGVLYDLRIQKLDEDGNPLAGAKFNLARAWADSLGNRYSDIVKTGLVSDADGYVTVTGLPWGAYTVTETQAPDDFVIPAAHSCEAQLCYTSNADSLTASSLVSATEHHAMQAGSILQIVNPYYKHDVTLLKVDANDNSKPVKGAKFSIWRDDGDGKFNSETDVYVGEFGTDQTGQIVFSQLRVGTYFFQEVYTPAGYSIDGAVHSFHVFSKHEQAGGTGDNMIQVGDKDGSNMLAPNAPNTVTVADRPIPQLPATAGPGIGLPIALGTILVIAGVVLFILLDAKRCAKRLRAAAHGK